MRKEWSYCLAKKQNGKGDWRRDSTELYLLHSCGHQEENVLYFSKNDFKMCLYQCCSFSVMTGISDLQIWCTAFEKTDSLISITGIDDWVHGGCFGSVCRRKRGMVPWEPVAKKKKIWCGPKLSESRIWNLLMEIYHWMPLLLHRMSY